MNPNRCKTSIAGPFWVGLAVLVFSALPAQAQFVPRAAVIISDMGVMGLATSAYSTAQGQNAYMQDRQLQATSSMAKSQAWQNINRSMQTQAASQTVDGFRFGSRGAGLDVPASGAQPSCAKAHDLAGTDMAAVAPVQESSRPAPPREIMLWPTLLKEQRFDGDRTDVEAPFRRAYADGKPLTIQDYQGIIKTVENMKATVKGMESQLVEEEYSAVQKYLDDLIADAQKRIQAKEAAEKKRIGR